MSISVTSQIKKLYPRSFRLARKDKFRVVWLEDDLAYCARRGKGHERYLVRFTVDANGSVFVGCRTVSGASCKGIQFGDGCCGHIAAVILRWKPKKAKESRAA